jgi:metal-dependent hydrolase (beta-lactamase superfamily II)
VDTAGVLNTVFAGSRSVGIEKVHAVLGGLPPLSGGRRLPSPQRLRNQASQSDVVIPFHCSGPGFVNAMRETLGDSLRTSTTGTEFTFGRSAPCIGGGIASLFCSWDSR